MTKHLSNEPDAGLTPETRVRDGKPEDLAPSSAQIDGVRGGLRPVEIAPLALIVDDDDVLIP